MPIKEFKSKIFPWLNEPKWLNRLTLYFALGTVIITTLQLVFSYSGSLHTDVDSARYMLSALVQSEAAIVALVVTLSLVAVQLAAQSYSARVIEVFRRTPDLWILMGIYGVAIFYGLGVLKLIENPLVGRMSNLEGYVAFSYYLGVFAFVALVPYIWNTLEMLKPSTVIDILAKRITKESILVSIDEKQEKSDGKDPILPIVDIVRGSMMKYDTETVIYGLRVISNCAANMFEIETFKEKEERKISEHLFSHIVGIGRQAATREDSTSTLKSITILKNCGEIAIKNKLEDATANAATGIQVIGEAAMEKKLYKATIWAADSLGRIGSAAAKQNNTSGILQPIISLEDVGIASAKQHLGETIKEVAIALGWIGMATAKQKIEDLTLEAIWALGRIGEITMEQNLETATLDVIDSLDRVGKAATEQNLEDITLEVAKTHDNLTDGLSKLKKK
ncbi:MAG: DUF2254 family protein [Candidatus Methanoperedens sp.]